MVRGRLKGLNEGGLVVLAAEEVEELGGSEIGRERVVCCGGRGGAKSGEFEVGIGRERERESEGGC